MKSQGYQEIDHTADLALQVWGEDFQGLLSQAAKGLYHLLKVNINENIPVRQSFSIELDSREAMLVDFLNELLYLCEDQKQSFRSFSFSEEGHELLVKAEGEQVRSIERNIKAVTFHDLNIHENKTGLETTVTFDV